MNYGIVESLCRNIGVKSENIKLLGKLHIDRIESALGEASKLSELKLPILTKDTFSLANGKRMHIKQLLNKEQTSQIGEMLANSLGNRINICPNPEEATQILEIIGKSPRLTEAVAKSSFPIFQHSIAAGRDTEAIQFLKLVDRLKPKAKQNFINSMSGNMRKQFLNEVTTCGMNGGEPMTELAARYLKILEEVEPDEATSIVEKLAGSKPTTINEVVNKLTAISPNTTIKLYNLT